MLQQTTIQAVLPAYIRFLDVFPNVFRLAHATEEEIRVACRGLGYYRRFRMMHEAAQALVAGLESEHDPVPWPRDFKGWKELPGIGDYTAAAISSIAFGFPKAVVDGNVERVFCRLFDLQVIPDQKWKKVFQEVGDRLIPARSPSEFNQGLMELGQAICTKQSPKCSICPVQDHCLAYERNTQALAPRPKEAMTLEDVVIHLFIMEKRGRFAVIERLPTARFLKKTWSFASAIVQADGGLKWETPEVPITEAKEIARVRHGITKHRIEVVVHSLAIQDDQPGLRWIPADTIDESLVSNLDRKALHAYLKRKKAANKGLFKDDLFFESHA